jgi:phage-related tail protein
MRLSKLLKPNKLLTEGNVHFDVVEERIKESIDIINGQIEELKQKQAALKALIPEARRWAKEAERASWGRGEYNPKKPESEKAFDKFDKDSTEFEKKLRDLEALGIHDRLSY